MSTTIHQLTPVPAKPSAQLEKPARTGNVARTGNTMFGALRWLADALVWFTLLLLLAVLAVAVLIPRVAGATPYNVATGSMSPALPPGTLVVVKPTDFDKIRVGDVVTYQLRSGDPTVATHRVVAIGSDLSDGRYLRTQGDANEVADVEPVQRVQVRGTSWYAIPKLGYLSNIVNNEQRQLATYTVAGALIVFAFAMFGGSIRDRQLARQSETSGDGESA